MTHSKLILTPAPTETIPDSDAILKQLSISGLIKENPVTLKGETLYLPGERFLQLITFLGCSPFIRLEPENENDNKFSHLRLSQLHSEPVFRYGRNTTAPKCPRCGHKQNDWLTLIETSDNHCSHCGKPISAADLNWRQSAGWGRLFIEIWGVFPGEAVPSQELIRDLTALGCRWDYFYIQD